MIGWRRAREIKFQPRSLMERRNGCRYHMYHPPYSIPLYLSPVEEGDLRVVGKVVLAEEVSVTEAAWPMEVIVLKSKRQDS